MSGSISPYEAHQLPPVAQSDATAAAVVDSDDPAIILEWFGVPPACSWPSGQLHRTVFLEQVLARLSCGVT